MTSELQSEENSLFVAELKQSAGLLVEKLKGDNFEEVSHLIGEVTSVRDKHLYQSIGRLTRGLHNAIVNFNVDGDAAENAHTDGKTDVELKDASNRLQYVLKLTQDAADKTMDMVDEASPVAASLGKEAGELGQEWKRLKRKEMTTDEFRVLFSRMETFLDEMESGSAKMATNLQEIFLAQGFQDLTGQVLKRVMSLVGEIEEDLVSLVRIAGQVETITGLDATADSDDGVSIRNDSKSQGEGPQINADKNDVLAEQDEVDDLLSSLGF